MSTPLLNAPPLNIQPQGLLDFLQLKNGGRNPQHFGEVVQPTWDLQRHYVETNAIEGGNNVAIATATNVFVQMEPPADYWRYVVMASVIWTPANALDLFTGQIIILRPADGRTYPVNPNQCFSGTGLTNLIQCAADANLTVKEFGASDFWVPPGFGLALRQHVAISTGGLATMILRERFIRLRQ